MIRSPFFTIITVSILNIPLRSCRIKSYQKVFLLVGLVLGLHNIDGQRRQHIPFRSCRKRKILRPQPRFRAGKSILLQ